ncbi:nucleolar complex protein [Nesidiocoris tenuis]|nr:nucleolar complex protein [Nesidiocoris tenuis]
MSENRVQSLTKELESSDEIIVEIDEHLSALENSNDVSAEFVSSIGSMLVEISKKLKTNKTVQNDYTSWLKDSYNRGNDALEKIVTRSAKKDLRVVAFKALVGLIPLHNDAFESKNMFPYNKYADLLRTLMICEHDISPVLPHLKDVLRYDDMKKSLWKALDLATQMDRLPVVKELSNIIRIVQCYEAPKKTEEPKQRFVRVKAVPLKPKETDKCLRRLWERLAMVKMDKDVKQLLLLALLEKIMPLMDRPVFLTDYFMGSLEEGGAIAVLALQGILELIQKYNMNYPDVYGKLYSMFTPDLFQTPYKSRFYYLSNLFMSSTMLPEALVAGFVKRLARLALVASPTDIIIILTFIINLIIRHPNLKCLMSRPGIAHFDSDPYLPNEPNPAESRAIDSCLWEVKLLQDHVVPTVAHTAHFIDQELPEIEKDMSAFLDHNIQHIFEKEMCIKVEEPPLTFERPSSTFLHKPSVMLAFSAWE